MLIWAGAMVLWIVFNTRRKKVKVNDDGDEKPAPTQSFAQRSSIFIKKHSGAFMCYAFVGLVVSINAPLMTKNACWAPFNTNFGLEMGGQATLSSQFSRQFMID